MKKWVKIFGLMVMWEFVFYGCGGGGGGGEGVNYKLGPKTKWVEKDTNWKLESKEENRLIYTYTGNPPDIKEGDILLSVEGGGYLRKVVDVDVEGGRLIVITEQASLEEAFEELDIKTTIKLPQSAELSPPGIFQSPPYPVKSPLTIEMGALNIPISYSIPIDYGTMGVEGSFKFTPSVDVEIKISMFKLKKFRLVLRGEVQQGLGVNMGIEKGIEKEYEIPLIDYGGLIAPTPVQLFAVAIGPVLINGKFTLSGGIGVSLDAGIDGGFGYDTSLTMGGGVEYMDGNWNPVTEFDYEFNPYFDYKVYAGLEGEVYLKPRLGIYIYDAAGPYFQLKPYGKGAITFIPNIHLEAGLGLSGSIGGSVKILSWSLVDRNYELFDFYEVLWEKDLTGGAICGNGVCESGESATSCPQDCGGGGGRGPTLLWSYTTGYYVFSSPALGDIDNDGKLEVVVGSFDNKIYALNGEDGSLLWSYTTGHNVDSSPSLGDIDSDGKLEVIMGSWDNKIYALNGEDGTLLWNYQIESAVDTTSPSLGDIDNDGKLEVVVGSYDGKIYTLNGENGSLLWSFQTGGSVYSSPAIADINNDGRFEVVAGSFDNKIYALNGEDGSLLWSYKTEGEVRSSPALGDIDNDGKLEVVVGSYDNKIYALNGEDGSLLWSYETGYDVDSSPALGDIDNDGKLEVVVGSLDHKIYALSTGSPVPSPSLLPWPKFKHDLKNTGRWTGNPNPPW